MATSQRPDNRRNRNRNRVTVASANRPAPTADPYPSRTITHRAHVANIVRPASGMTAYGDPTPDAPITGVDGWGLTVHNHRGCPDDGRVIVTRAPVPPPTTVTRRTRTGRTVPVTGGMVRTRYGHGAPGNRTGGPGYVNGDGAW